MTKPSCRRLTINICSALIDKEDTMENTRNDQVIFVKDLLFAALYKWRWIIAMAIAFALVLGGIVGASQWKATSNVASEEVIQEAMADYENELQLLQKAEDDAQKLVDSQEEYNLNSAMMSLDPYSVYNVTIELTVLTESQIQSEAENNTGAILHAYASYLNSNKVIDALAEALQIQSKYLSELIVMDNGGSETKCLSITVSYPDKEGAETILDQLSSEVENANTFVTQKLGAHNYSYTASVDERIDLTVIAKQEEAAKRLETLRTALTTAQQQRQALQMPSFGVSASVKKVVIFAVLGAFFGAAMVVGCAWVGHIVNNNVYSARVLKNKTGLRILGCVPANGKKNPIDAWLRKLEGRSLGEHQLPVVVATVKNYCAEAKNVLILGDCAQADMEPVADALAQENINVMMGGNLLRDPAAPEKLPECDCVLLVEKCGSSSYANILLTAERIADQNKILLGCVLVEG